MTEDSFRLLRLVAQLFNWYTEISAAKFEIVGYSTRYINLTVDYVIDFPVMKSLANQPLVFDGSRLLLLFPSSSATIL